MAVRTQAGPHTLGLLTSAVDSSSFTPDTHSHSSHTVLIHTRAYSGHAADTASTVSAAKRV